MSASSQSFQQLLHILRAHLQASSAAVEALAKQHFLEVDGPVSRSVAIVNASANATYSPQIQSLRFGALDGEDAVAHAIQVPAAANMTSLHEVDVPNECDELIAKPVHERVGAHARVVVPGHAGMPVGMKLSHATPIVPEENYHEFTDITKSSGDDPPVLPRELSDNPNADAGLTSLTSDDIGHSEGRPDVRLAGDRSISSVTDSAALAEWSMEITPIWLERKKRTRRITTKQIPESHDTAKSKSKLHFSRSRSMVGASMRSDASLDRQRNIFGGDKAAGMTAIFGGLVASPTSSRRLVWDVSGMFLIGYDLITIPFQTFDPPDNWFTDAISMITTIFWTIDIPCSFLVGYHKDGFIEMSLGKIAQRYMRTWMPFDLLVISIDWAAIIMTWVSGDGGGVQEDVGLVRLGKSARFLRVMRLLRLLKVHGRLAEIFERMQSEIVRIALGIIKNVVLIILANHVFACGFWGIGTIDESWQRSWVKFFKMKEDRTIAYQYTTSLHWSLTQFTPASMEIVPRNALERTYTVCVLLLAMITFSSFISSLTNAMTQLRNLNSDKYVQQLILRKYIMQNNVPTSLATRVWSWLQSNPGKRKDRIHESDVAILPTLPSALQAEMQDQVFRPTLIVHPFFFQFSVEWSVLVRRIFRCLQEVSVGIEKELFHLDMNSDKMFFVISGTLLYQECVRRPGAPASGGKFSSRSSGMNSMQELSAGGWACEPALWTKWKHRGVMVTKTHTEMFALLSTEFQQLMQVELRDCWQAARYARLFVKTVKDRKIFLTDVWCDFDTLQEIAHRAFEEEDDDVIEEKLTRSFTSDSKGSRTDTDEELQAADFFENVVAIDVEARTTPVRDSKTPVSEM